jgi:hypothetical protein
VPRTASAANPGLRCDGCYGLRRGGEHDTTCARAATGLIAGLEAAAAHGIPTLTDLGYLHVSTAIRTPVKKSKGGELTDAQKQYNLLIRGVHAPAY